MLRGLKAPVYRWPGGNFVSGYDWHDGIGERDKRPPRRNPAWTGVESNDVGIHEFMRLCELLDTEPYIAVNAGLGGVKEAADEVEYCNGAEDTPMGKWRKQNGQAKPWKVKWWSVGNEMFGDWQLGFMSTEAFVKKHNSFADAMWKVDSSIHLIAVGEVGRWFVCYALYFVAVLYLFVSNFLFLPVFIYIIYTYNPQINYKLYCIPFKIFIISSFSI